MLIRERDMMLKQINAWVIRKYTFNVQIRVLTSIILSRIRAKNNLYCAEEQFKKNYVKFTELLTDLNPKLMTIRYKFIDSLVDIHKSNLGIAKVGKLCWY